MIIQFIVFGLTGWCMEIMWTGLHSLVKRDFRLISNTSIWMFFIYGLAVFLGPVSKVMSSYPVIIRGGVYAICIFAAEFVTGMLMKTLNMCPWDYSSNRFSVMGVIRLDYLPVWFAVGLIMEYLHKILEKVF